MKKLVLVLAVAFTGVLNAQKDSVNNEFIVMIDEVSIRREMGGYKLDTNVIFEPVLKKLIEGRLDIDSLESKQKALYRIKINDFFDETGNERTPILTYFRNFDLDKIKDTTNFEMEYFQDEFFDGEINETVVLYDKQTRKQVLYIRLMFETYSNLIYNMIVQQYD